MRGLHESSCVHPGRVMRARGRLSTDRRRADGAARVRRRPPRGVGPCQCQGPVPVLPRHGRIGQRHRRERRARGRPRADWRITSRKPGRFQRQCEIGPNLPHRLRRDRLDRHHRHSRGLPSHACDTGRAPDRWRAQPRRVRGTAPHNRLSEGAGPGRSRRAPLSRRPEDLRVRRGRSAAGPAVGRRRQDVRRAHGQRIPRRHHAPDRTGGRAEVERGPCALTKGTHDRRGVPDVLRHARRRRQTRSLHARQRARVRGAGAARPDRRRDPEDVRRDARRRQSSRAPGAGDATWRVARSLAPSSAAAAGRPGLDAVAARDRRGRPAAARGRTSPRRRADQRQGACTPS